MCQTDPFGYKRRQTCSGTGSQRNKEFDTLASDIRGQLKVIMEDLLELGIGGVLQVERTLEHKTVGFEGYFPECCRSFPSFGRCHQLQFVGRFTVSVNQIEKAKRRHQLSAGATGERFTPVAAVDSS